MDYQYSEITPEVIELAKLCTQKGGIDPSLYAKYEVKRGLRDINGKGEMCIRDSYSLLFYSLN